MCNILLENREEIQVFTVEKDVPINAGLRIQWPFRHMKVGESFLVKADPELIQKCRLAAGTYSASYRGTKQTRYKITKRFSVRKQADGTARCWRTA